MLLLFFLASPISMVKASPEALPSVVEITCSYATPDGTGSYQAGTIQVKTDNPFGWYSNALYFEFLVGALDPPWKPGDPMFHDHSVTYKITVNTGDYTPYVITSTGIIKNWSLSDKTLIIEVESTDSYVITYDDYTPITVILDANSDVAKEVTQSHFYTVIIGICFHSAFSTFEGVTINTNSADWNLEVPSMGVVRLWVDSFPGSPGFFQVFVPYSVLEGFGATVTDIELYFNDVLVSPTITTVTDFVVKDGVGLDGVLVSFNYTHSTHKIDVDMKPTPPLVILTPEQKAAISHAKEVVEQIDVTGVIKKESVEEAFNTLLENNLLSKPDFEYEPVVAEDFLTKLKKIYGENLERYPTVEGRIWLLYMLKAS
jgi:hypothetical protein